MVIFCIYRNNIQHPRHVYNNFSWCTFLDVLIHDTEHLIDSQWGGNPLRRSYFIASIKLVTYSWSEWVLPLISLPLLSSLGKQWTSRSWFVMGSIEQNCLCCHGIRGALSVIVNKMTSSHFFFLLPHLPFWDIGASTSSKNANYNMRGAQISATNQMVIIN